MFVFASLFVCSVAFAASTTSPAIPATQVAAMPVSFSFGAVPLVQFAQATYRDLLHRDFVLSNDLVGLGKKVTVSVKNLPADKLPAFVDQVLSQQGVRSVLRDGVYFLDAAGSGSADSDQVQPGAAAAVDQLAKPVPQLADVKSDAGMDAASVERDAIRSGQAKPAANVYKVYQAMNRPADFMVAALNGAAGSTVAKPVGGTRFVLSAPADKIDALADLVEQLDVAAVSVEVAASFVEVTSSQSGASGLSLVAGLASRRLGVSVTPERGSVAIVGGRYDLVLQALAADGRFKQISNSRVVGDDAEKLLLSVGDEVPTIASTSKDNAGNPVQNVVYRPSGVILDVLPHVLGSGRLSLAVDGQVSSFQTTTTGVAGSPTLVKRQVKTSVTLGDGDVLVIGGLDDSKATGSSGGFSFLPASWRSRSSSDTKTDLVLILSARVVVPGRAMAQKNSVTSDEKPHINVTGDI